ncbi:MAG: hypothetical protein ACE5IH_08485 [Thermodesulfobacteriota bacterium]
MRGCVEDRRPWEFSEKDGVIVRDERLMGEVLGMARQTIYCEIFREQMSEERCRRLKLNAPHCVISGCERF